MKQNVYLYDVFFNEEEGVSVVGLMTPHGIFSGSAKLNADEDQWNEITGGTLTELRAWKNYYKHEIRLRKFAIQELKTVYSQMKKNWKREPLADRIAFLELEVDACKAEIKSVDDEIAARLARLDKIGQK